MTRRKIKPGDLASALIAGQHAFLCLVVCRPTKKEPRPGGFCDYWLVLESNGQTRVVHSCWLHPVDVTAIIV